MKTGQDHRIEPSEVSPEILRQLEEMVLDRRRPVLVGQNGEHIELPDALNDLLVFVVEAMKRKQAIFLMPEDAAFTTQAAAQFLGMSRPYLLRLLDAGKIPFHRVGTHRRIMLRDLRAYQVQRDDERRGRLDALTEAVEDAGVYDRV
jgi:excisionase family DNA binding protein